MSHFLQEPDKPGWTAAQREQEVNSMKRWQRDHQADLPPYAPWDISNYYWRSQRWWCDPFFAKLRSAPSPPLRLFFPVSKAWTCTPPTLSVSRVCYLSVVLATQAVRKLWRWIGFRSTAFTPVGLRDFCTSFCVYLFFFSESSEPWQMFCAIVFLPAILPSLHYIYFKDK